MEGGFGLNNAFYTMEQPKNEPVKGYVPGSAERASLKVELARQAALTVEIPLVVGGRELTTGTMGKIVMPHDHQHTLATYHNAGEAGLDHMADLVRAYFDLDGHHIQFNVIDRETLREAQRNPDEYRDLIVRVAGYSDYFRNLSRALQDEIIDRTEQSF